ncbi:MAG: hypothetical protein EOO10_00355 [Chitinophagaceae bacterium]|nr:MAG: hypothetical protein EOO10_00355 [Chitinophagaceae bacterium]
MAANHSLSGQWLGEFIYGSEFGDELHGEKVSFRLFLRDKGNYEFEGTSVDIEGIHANFDEAIIKGFMDDHHISFTKEYSTYYVIDEEGNSTIDKGQAPRLSYSGEFNYNLKKFSGDWELIANEKLFGDGSFVDIFTGTWEMMKDD